MRQVDKQLLDILIDGQRVGYLWPIQEYTQVSIALLVKWRNSQREYFFYQGEVTPESTIQWVKGMIERTDRTCFWITVDGQAVGTYGYQVKSPRVAEICNLVRGEPGGPRGLIRAAEIALHKHLYENCGFAECYCEVFSTNTKVIRLHNSTGYMTYQQKPMILDGQQYVFGEGPNQVMCDCMTANYARFLEAIVL